MRNYPATCIVLILLTALIVLGAFRPHIRKALGVDDKSFEVITPLVAAEPPIPERLQVISGPVKVRSSCWELYVVKDTKTGKEYLLATGYGQSSTALTPLE